MKRNLDHTPAGPFVMQPCSGAGAARAPSWRRRRYEHSRNHMTRSTCHPWLDRFAWLTAAATFLLLGLGGLVTSHEAGLAVPDWPTTYGYNMFLFPMHLWQSNIFYEHTHRLLASFVGLLTTILAVWLWLREPRSWLRWLGAGAFFAILLQGLLGGLRVTLLKDEIGIFHATLAQCFFVLVTLIALFSSGAAAKFADSFRTTRISVARLDFSGGVYLDVWRNGSGGGTGGRCPPGPLGFIAFMLLQQKVAPGDPGGHPAFCCLQPPDGARVASPQSPILRWRKGGPLHDGGEGPFPFPLPWRSIGRASWERGWAGGPSPELSGARLELLRL